MHSSDNVRDNVSQSYTTTGNIIVVYHHYDGQMTGDNCGIIFPICVLPVVVVVVVALVVTAVAVVAVAVVIVVVVIVVAAASVAVTIVVVVVAVVIAVVVAVEVEVAVFMYLLDKYWDGLHLQITEFIFEL